MTRIRLIGAWLGWAMLLNGCQWIIGPLTECTSDPDCAPKGAALTCQNRLCVQDSRCTVLGSSDPAALTFGLVLPYTANGVPDPNTPNWRNAVSLVLEEINPPVQQGIAGHQVAVVSCNSDNDPDTARAFALRFIAAGIPAILSDGSSETLGVAAATVPAGDLLLTGYSKSPEVTALPASPNGVRLVWRTMVSDAYVAQEVASYLNAGNADAGTPTKVAAVVRNDAYGQGFYDAFSPAYTGQQFAYYFNPDGSTDATALAGAAGYAPTTVVWKGFPEDLVRLLNLVHSTPAYAPLAQAAWIFDDQILSPGLLNQLAAPGQVEGSLAVFAAAAFGNPGHTAFLWLQQEFEQVYGLDPGSTPMVAAYSDAIMLVLVSAGTQATLGQPGDGTSLARVLGRVSDVDGGQLVPLDPAHLNLALSALSAGEQINVDGASGPLDFNPADGEAVSAVDVYKVVNGQFTLVEAIPPP